MKRCDHTATRLSSLGIVTVVCLLLSTASLTAQEITTPPVNGQPLVWVFMGLPGDVEHLLRFSETVDLLAKAFRDRFGLAEEDVRILFGEGDWGGHKPCTQANLEAELEQIVAATRQPEPRPVWVFFLGHANSTEHDAFFNIGGTDPSARALGRDLRNVRASTPLVLWLTTAASGKFVKHLTKTGRVVVAACADDAEDNETEFPHILAQALGAASTDADEDGYVSVLELFMAVKTGLQKSYESDGLIQTERPLLDGDGDAQATATPAETDAARARALRLSIKK